LPEERHTSVNTDGSGTAASDVVELKLDWQPDRTIVLVKEESAFRKVYEENTLLIEHYSEPALNRTRNTYLSQDGRLAVMLRSTNLVPDELVKLDLKTGKMVALFSPNESFRKKTEGITVRFMPIDVAGSKLYGRLFLPVDYDKSMRYPLVVAPYLATAGFALGSGELPILPLVAHGIAVFVLDATNVQDEVGRGGNIADEVLRVERPLEAMGWVVEKLAGEGVVDPTRVGVNGLSYGAEISMYAYWKSDIFRTVSATDGTWEPILYLMGGVVYGGRLSNVRGFPEPKDGAYAEWKRLSAGLNARSTLPPLLWQSPDQEESNCVESWFRLRRAGAQVEWLDYPDEGHVKRGPANIWWVHQRNLDWFRFWLKDEEDPDPRKAEQYTRWREMRKKWEAAKARISDSKN
jgi:dipeptidyl aminopeptidase/acylaminoacyl peptidase